MIELKEYRDKWLSECFDDYIGFCNREFYCLDNSSSFKIWYQGRLFSTVEEAYQAIGFMEAAPDIAKEIIQSNSAHMAKKIAHENKHLRRPDWDNVKLDIMEALLRAKLEQHEYVRKKLLETGDYQIVEDSPKDSYWGCGPDRKGSNHLGRLWMKLRDELRNDRMVASIKNTVETPAGCDSISTVNNDESVEVETVLEGTHSFDKTMRLFCFTLLVYAICSIVNPIVFIFLTFFTIYFVVIMRKWPSIERDVCRKASLVFLTPITIVSLFYLLRYIFTYVDISAMR